MTKLVDLIVKVISAFSIFANAAKDLYHAVQNGVKKLVAAVKDGLDKSSEKKDK